MDLHRTSTSISPVLDAPLISRIRRNHGLEHATLHLLAQRFPQRAMAGHSDMAGFWIIGNLSTFDVQWAVSEALGRLRLGQADLAIHPNCGTNLATAGVLAGLGAALVMLGSQNRLRERLERLPLAILMATAGVVLARPLGLLLQEHVTTSGFPEGLEIVKITPTTLGRLKVHRITTRN